MTLHAGDHILFIRIGRHPQYVVAQGEVTDDDFDGREAWLTASNLIWEYDMQREVFETAHGRVMVVWPDGVNGPTHEWVAACIAAIAGPVVH